MSSEKHRLLSDHLVTRDENLVFEIRICQIKKINYFIDQRFYFIINCFISPLHQLLNLFLPLLYYQSKFFFWYVCWDFSSVPLGTNLDLFCHKRPFMVYWHTINIYIKLLQNLSHRYDLSQLLRVRMKFENYLIIKVSF